MENRKGKILMYIYETSIFNTIAQYRDEYSSLMLSAMKEGLAKVEMVVSINKHIGGYYDFPTLSYNKNGLPILSSSLFSAPTEYKKCFEGREPLINESELETFNNLVAFVRKYSELHTRFIPENYNSENSIFNEIDSRTVKSMIEGAIERYIHMNNSLEYDKAKAISIIDPFVAYIFNEKLDIDIVVPLLFLDFKVDEYKISDNVYIERISDSYHLSRYKLGSNNISTNQSVVASATHALVFRGWHVPNKKSIWNSSILYKPEAYPLDLIEMFLGALRISTDIDTGYAQIYSVARGWCSSLTTANLPYIEGVTIRSYPSFFENYYWNMDIVPKISMDNIKDISLIYQELINAKENSIDIALKRLNRCLVRDNEEDSVLDATIALEALFSDDGNQEMTHKLAMRVWGYY